MQNVECEFCYDAEPSPAVVIAPIQWVIYTKSPTWVPVCERHFDGWYDRVPEPQRLPAFRLDQKEANADNGRI